MAGMCEHECSIGRECGAAGLRLGDPEQRGSDVSGFTRAVQLHELRIRRRGNGPIAAFPGHIGEPPRSLAREPGAAELRELLECPPRLRVLTEPQRDHAA
jgi:hypothetical protein